MARRQTRSRYGECWQVGGRIPIWPDCVTRTLDKLPPAERQQWRVLWQKVAEVEKCSEDEPPRGPALARLRERIEGKWRHVVAGEPREIMLFRSGKINDESSRATWTLQGRTLTLTWPDDLAPDRAWVDRCRVSEDGNSYAGINQQGADVRGTKTH